MLAASSNLSEVSQQASTAQGMQDRLCPGCKKSAVTEDGGLVVAFGQSFFHVDCFRCAKCGEQVTADTNLLLLSDGSPICANCSYSCSVCREPILDEAIMTGDDSYHAHCFKCKVCKKRIEELVFARTSQGIYCMDCHNERMIKIRKHAQRKAERERTGGSSSSRSREQVAQEFHRENGRASPASARTPGTPGIRPHIPDSRPGSSRGLDSSSARSPGRSYVGDAFDPNVSTANSPRNINFGSPSSPTVAVTVSPSDDPNSSRLTIARRASYISQGLDSPSLAEFGAKPPPTKNNTLPIPGHGDDANRNGRRKSYDDGVRPLNILFDIQAEPENVGGLVPPTSRKDKRRSINPGLVLGEQTRSLGASSTNLLSPISVSFAGASVNRSASPPSSNDSHVDDPRVSWPASDRSIATSTTSEQWRDATSRPPSIQSSQEGKVAEGKVADTHGRPARSSFASSLNVRSRSSSRPSSPGHQADVPHSVESGTDDEAEAAEEEVHTLRVNAPPAPPPKEDPPIANDLTSISAPNSSVLGSLLDNDSDLSDASPVETSHTFIAPALPPIRFSLPADFSDLWNSVGGEPPSKGEKQMATVPENKEATFPSPPLTASSDGVSISSGVSTVVASQTDSPKANTAVINDTPKPSEESRNDALRPPRLKPRSSRRSTDELARPSTAPSSSNSPSTSSSVLAQSVDRAPLDANRVFSPAITVTQPGDPDMVVKRIQEVLADTQKRGVQQVKLDRQFLEVILSALESKWNENTEMKSHIDGMKRESRQYIEGLTVAQTEYDQELKARRDAESEVTRLRVLLSGQAARLTALSEESRRQELRQQRTKELNDDLTGLEQNISKLRVERDMTLAEVEELSLSKSSSNGHETPPSNMSRSLTLRLDTIKSKYQRELIPLKEQKESLAREIAELKAVRDVFLEETTVLNARNEELARLSTHYSRRMDVLPETPPKQPTPAIVTPNPPRGSSMDKPRPPPPMAPAISLPAPSTSMHDDDSRFISVSKTDVDIPTPGKKGFKWPIVKTPLVNGSSRNKARSEHAFQQISNVRFTRCDHCGDKMWGSQLRCSACALSVHVRCHSLVTTSCPQHSVRHKDDTPEPPSVSMFGRDLIEQVRADAKGGDLQVPIIVAKCITAVETLALDYEGIYRKTGGSSHTKVITQLFESGDYDAFDLTDPERFNDICSVTSVLKTYFRSLPNPLLTYELHDRLMSAIQLRDASVKSATLIDLIGQLPSEHYHTVRFLMLHLHNVSQHSANNLMNARNLGVVFGPTLLRSQDPAAEFSDMGSKALFIDWLIDNAPLVFSTDPPHIGRRSVDSYS